MAQGSAPTRPQRRYRSFISYSHADKRDAVWRRKRHEAHRAPKRLVREAGAPKRLRPVSALAIRAGRRARRLKPRTTLR